MTKEVFRTSILVDKDVWNKAKDLVRTDLNMSMSAYIEVILRQTVLSKTTPAKDLYESMAKDLFAYAERQPNRKIRRKIKMKG